MLNSNIFISEWSLESIVLPCKNVMLHITQLWSLESIVLPWEMSCFILHNYHVIVYPWRYSNGICYLCSNNIETIRHLFFECSKIQHLWKACIGKLKVFVPNEQLSLTYTLLVIGSVNSKHKTIINTFLFATKFMIWKCRNYKKYEHSEVFLIKSHKY